MRHCEGAKRPKQSLGILDKLSPFLVSAKNGIFYLYLLQIPENLAIILSNFRKAQNEQKR